MTNELAIRILTGDVLGTTEQTHEAIKMAVKALSLPSAEPEIIHCKDCKHWMSAYLAISGKHGCNKMRDYTAPNDYCFKAERKEG